MAIFRTHFTRSIPLAVLLLAIGTASSAKADLVYFTDSFQRADANPSPWATQAGSFGVTNAALQGTASPDNYAFAYFPANWTDYSVEAMIQFSSSNALGAAIGARLNPTNGSHYAAWVYPENSVTASRVVRLVKFTGWGAWSGVPMASATIASVGTNTHQLRMTVTGSLISIAYDGATVITMVDNNAEGVPAFTSGGITMDMYADSGAPFVFSVDDIRVTARPLVTITPDNAARPFGGANPSVNVNVTGLLGTDTIQATANIAADFLSPAGSYPILASVTDSNSVLTNYTVVTNQGVLTITPSNIGILFRDDFIRATDPAIIAPWTTLQGNFSITNQALLATGPANDYSYAYIANPGWSNYFVSGQLRFSSLNAWGGGLGGRLNPINGAHYGAWVYPDSSQGGGNTVKLIKFRSWTTWSGVPFAEATIPAVGTNAHVLSLSFQDNRIIVNFDGTPVIDVTDDGFDNSAPLTAGGITADMYTDSQAPYVLSCDNVVVQLSRPVLTLTASDATRTYGETNPVFSAQISGVANNDNLSVSAFCNADTNTGAGIYPIIPVLLDPNNKAPNYEVRITNGSLTILRAPLTITANDTNRQYGQTNPNLTAIFNGFVNDETPSVLAGSLVVTTPATSSNAVGTYPIIASGLSSSNYSLSYSNGTLTVTTAPLTVNIDSQLRLYGATNPPLTGSIVGLQNTDPITASYSTTAEINSPTGTYPIDVALSDPAGRLVNYLVSTNLGSLTVAPAPLLAAVNNSTRAYGHTNPVFSTIFTGFVNGETEPVLAGTLVYSTLADSNSPIGTYDVSASGLTSTNYTVSYTNGVLTITPFELTVTPDNKSRLYGAPNPELTGQIIGLQNSDAISASYSTFAQTNSPVGSYNILASLNDPANKLTNYAVTTNVGTLSILPAALLVQANDTNRLYGQPNPTFGATLTGFVNDEDTTALGGSLTLTSADTNSSVGTYAIVPAGLTSSNYTITFSNGVLTIAQSPLQITIDSKSRVYGAANPLLTGTIVGLQNDDTITPTYTTAATTNTVVGNYPITALLTDPGSKLSNYSVTTNTGTLGIFQGTTTLALGSSSQGVAGPNSITFTVQVAPVAPSFVPAQGTALLFVNGLPAGQTSALNNGVGQATVSLPAGVNQIVAAYLGDANYGPSISGMSQTVTNDSHIVAVPASLGIVDNHNGTVTVTLSGTPGAEYLIQTSSSLNAFTWTDLKSGIASDDGKWTITDAIGDNSIRFYRAVYP